MTNLGKPISQRQLRVGEMLKQALGMLFIREEAKIPNFSTKEITVTEVRMSPDLKTAKIFVIPLGGKDAEKTVDIITEFSHLISKALAKKIDTAFQKNLREIGGFMANFETTFLNQRNRVLGLI